MLATKSNSYTFQKDGIWYFSRRVPADLRRHYRTNRIAYSLRTKSVRDARVRAMSDAANLNKISLNDENIKNNRLTSVSTFSNKC